MKKALILLLAAALVVSLASVGFAGELSAKGAKIGLNMSNLAGDDVDNNKMKIGFAIGGFVEWSINEQIAIQPELEFTMRGAKYDVDGDPALSLNYISIPILAKYKFAAENMTPFAFLGPELNMLMSADYDGTDVKDNTKGMDFGLTLGGGVSLENGLIIDIRYYLGLSSIDDSDADASIKNTNIMLGVGYAF